MSVQKWQKLIGRLVTVHCIDSMADYQRTEESVSTLTLYERKPHGILLHVDDYKVVVGYETPVGAEDKEYDCTVVWTPAVKTIEVERPKKKRSK